MLETTKHIYHTRVRKAIHKAFGTYEYFILRTEYGQLMSGFDHFSGPSGSQEAKKVSAFDN